MKGVLLAGGRGTRLQEITKGKNKHLLPIQGGAMFLYGLRLLVRSGISDLSVVVNPNEEVLFRKELMGTELENNNIRFVTQYDPSGIPHGLSLCLGETEQEPCVLLLGDNFFEDDLSAFIRAWNPRIQPAHIFLKQVPDCSPFGVAYLIEGRVTSLCEKPQSRDPGLAVTGCYLLDSSAMERIPLLKPSRRGETEVLDLLNLYLKEKGLYHQILTGRWADGGTPKGLNSAQKLCEGSN